MTEEKQVVIVQLCLSERVDSLGFYNTLGFNTAGFWVTGWDCVNR